MTTRGNQASESRQGVQAIAKPSVAQDNFDARADAVTRWRDARGEFYLLEGRCRLATPEGLITVEKAMVRVSRDVEQNRWQVTVGSDSDLMLNNRKRLPASKPLRWTVASEPTIDAPNYRGVAKTRPVELAWLGEETIAPVQHLANDKQPTQGLIESLPVPPADPDQVQPAGASTPPFQQAWQPPSTAGPGEVIAPDVPMTPAAPSDQSASFKFS